MPPALYRPLSLWERVRVRDIVNKLRSEENRVDVTESVEGQGFETSPHGIADEQRAGQDGGGTDHAEHDGSVDPSVVPERAE